MANVKTSEKTPKPKPIITSTEPASKSGWFRVEGKGGSGIPLIDLPPTPTSSSSSPHKERVDGGVDAKELGLLGTRGGLHALRAHIKNGKKGKGRGSLLGPILRTGIVGETAVTPAVSSGAYNAWIGHSTFTGSSDYAPLSGLYDLCRLVAVTFRYEPFGPNSIPLNVATISPTASLPVHVPMLVSYNADSQSASTYNIMANSKDYNETHHNLVTNTGKPWRKRFAFDTKKVIASGSSTYVPTSGQWINATTSVVPAGGILISIYPTAINGVNGVQVGRLVYTAEYEWQSRE